MVIYAEDLVQDLLAAGVLGVGRFGRDTVPELVVLGEAGLDLPGGEERVDVGFRATVVAGVDADAFPEQFFDGWDERVVRRQLQARERQVGRLQTPGQRRCVVRLRVRDLLDRDLMGPEVVGDQGLGNAVVVEVGVIPGVGGVAVDFGPVAL